MLVRVAKLALLCLALMLVAAPSNAASLNFGPFILGSGVFFPTNSDTKNGSFVDTWDFIVGGQLGTETTLSSTTPPNGAGGSGIENLIFQWDSGPSAQFTGAGVLYTSVSALVATLSPGAHTLTVSGTGIGSGGQYDFSITATPLPAALVLFGSGLLGLTLLGR